jgi:hypothetical protein
MKRLKLPKPVLLLAAAGLTSLALSLPARPAQALGCGNGCYSGAGVIYYTDATRTKVYCRTDCNIDTCNGGSTPWYHTYHTCCCI